MIIFAAVMYVETFSYAVVPGYERMGPEVWPRFVLAGITFLSLLIMIRALRRRGKDPSGTPAPQTKMNTSHVLVCAVALFFVTILVPYLGFLFSAFLGMIVFSYILGARGKFTIFWYSIASVAAIYLVFGRILLVPMPRGVSIFRELSFYLY